VRLACGAKQNLKLLNALCSRVVVVEASTILVYILIGTLDTYESCYHCSVASGGFEKLNPGLLLKNNKNNSQPRVSFDDTFSLVRVRVPLICLSRNESF
jgi:hypothetical protein